MLQASAGVLEECADGWEICCRRSEECKGLGFVFDDSVSEFGEIGHAGMVACDSGCNVRRSHCFEGHSRAVNGVGALALAGEDHVLEAGGVFAVIVQEGAPFRQVVEM
jgi:hypothetical protein